MATQSSPVRYVPPFLIGNGYYKWGAKVLRLPTNIASLPTEAHQKFMRSLESADTNRIFQILKPTELKDQIIKNVSEIEKTMPPGKIYYLFKTIDHCGKALLVVIYVVALTKASL